MKRNRIGIAFVFATLGITLFLIFGNDDINNMRQINMIVDYTWIALAAMGLVICWFADSCALYSALRSKCSHIPFRYAMIVSLIGAYFSNITPGATGGQPMEAYYLSKNNVPYSISSSALATKFFSQQVTIVLVTSVLWICNADFVSTQLSSVRWAINVGFFINFISVPLIVLIATNKPVVDAIIGFIVRIGIKLKLIKKPDEVQLRINVEMDNYHTNIRQMFRTPKFLIVQIILAALRIFALMSIALCVYYAFNPIGYAWNQILTIAFLLFISASYTPLPGSSGAQEVGFLLFFKGLYTPGTIGLALLVWRLFTFYLPIIIGACSTFGASIYFKSKE
ncbi:MAG: flippase-like domain-containing protein [Dehalobacter sp. 4CP]|nr:flippase-like domain-containing protein [Dehalobacter sp. 4CP]